MLKPNNIKSMVLKDFGDVKLALEAMAGNGLIRKDVEKVLTESAQPLINSMKAKVPVDTGRLRESITVWSAKRNPYRVYVGPSYRIYNGGRIAHILEYGTVERVMKKGLRAGNITQTTMQKFKGPPIFVPYKGKRLGAVVARPFIRPAVEETRSEVSEKLKVNVLDIVQQKAIKLGFEIK